jgi:ABC-type transport system involved in cytochrome bd biosynthesis fused ATPase/permease subunit
MLSPLSMTIIVAIIAVVVCIMVVAFVCLVRKHQKLKRDHEDLTEIVHGHNNDLRELFAASLTMDDRMAAIDGQLRVLSAKMNDFQQSEASNHPYSSAIQKVRSGASVSELMQNSGLSQDEAALLIRLHGAKPR